MKKNSSGRIPKTVVRTAVAFLLVIAATAPATPAKRGARKQLSGVIAHVAEPRRRKTAGHSGAREPYTSSYFRARRIRACAE